MKKILLILSFIASLSLTSCVDVDDIVVEDVVNIKSRGSGLKNMLLDVTLLVSNESSSKFSLKETVIEVIDGDKVSIIAKVDDKITVKKGVNEVVVPLKISLNLSFAQMFTITKRIDHLKFNISTRATGFLYSRNIKINNLSSKQFGQFVDIDLKKLFTK